MKNKDQTKYCILLLQLYSHVLLSILYITFI